MRTMHLQASQLITSKLPKRTQLILTVFIQARAWQGNTNNPLCRGVHFEKKASPRTVCCRALLL